MSQLAQDPKDLLNEGVARAKNMGVALFMIVFLLSKYFVVKVIWRPLEHYLSLAMVKVAFWLAKAYQLSRPHIERMKAIAAHTKNRVLRVVLELLIKILAPFETALLRFFGLAKTQSERLALQSTTSLLTVILRLATAIGNAIKAGLSRPAMQKLIAKLFEVLEDAQKA